MAEKRKQLKWFTEKYLAQKEGNNEEIKEFKKR
jgi:hypothetical protein